MSSKRGYATSDGGDVVEPAPKRSKKPNPKARDHQNAYIDPTWGQKYVFSASANATSMPTDPDLDFEDDADAMAYLKSVRTQANGIPHLLVAPKIPIGPQLPKEFQRAKKEDDSDAEEGEYEDEEQDYDTYATGQVDLRGYYEDGAYVARPVDWDWDHDAGEQDDADWEEGEDGEYGEAKHPYYDQDYNEDHDAALREAYFTSIASRFHALRKVLQTRPPAYAVAALPPTHGYDVDTFGRKSNTFPVWSERLRNTDPLPAQVASMDKEGVLRVMRVLLGGKFLRTGSELRERTSRWVWALLARLPERGELNYTEVGWIRELGKRAVLMMRSLADMAALRDEGRDMGVHDAVDASSDDEDVAGDMEVDERDGGEGGQEESAETPRDASEGKKPQETSQPAEDGEVEDGEIDDNDDQKSEAMDMSEDEGEVKEEEPPAPAETLEEVKARLLAQIDTATAEADDDEDTPARLRARMNMRATLNMILTVAGEFYGQRDLLEFRDPFTGM